MQLPIPSHFKGYFVTDAEEQTEFEVSGTIKCRCGSENFEVFSSNDRMLVKVKCQKCGEEIVLFDSGKHGWDGYVCKDDFLNREDPFVQYSCEQCGKQIFKVAVKISSQGKEDFIEECVNNDDSFSEEEWIEAFDWIVITLTCDGCESVEDGWLDMETM